MATNRRNNNKKDSKIVSNDNQELELIKINVEKVMRDLKDISNFAQKEITVVHRALNQSLDRAKDIKDKSSYKKEIKYAKELEKIISSIAKEQKEINKNRLDTLNEEQKARSEWAKQDIQNQKAALNEQRELIREQRNTQQSIAQSITKLDFGGFVSSIGSHRINQGQREIDQGMASAADDFARTGDRRTYDMRMREFGEASVRLDQSANRFQTAANVLSVVGETLKVFLNLFFDRFKKGMTDIVNTYETTFQNQAVQTGISEQEYFDKQTEMQESLNRQNLQNNIAVDTVMQATADFVANGVTDMSKAMALGEQSAIAKVLAPYLDLQSDALTSLELAMPGISKSMIGISGFVADSVGQSRFVQKNLNQLVELTGPVSLAAKKDLLGEEGLAMIEDLVAKGMDMESATKLATDVAEAVRNPLKGLQGDNIGIASAIAAGKRDFTGIASYTIRQQAIQQSGTGGDLATAAYLDASGGYGTYNFDMGTHGLDVVNRLESGYYKDKGSTISSEETYEQKLAKLADDQYTTSLAEKEIHAKNLSLQAAILEEKWPDLIAAVKAIVPGIASLFATWIGSKLISGGIGKGIGLLGGSGAGGTGAGLLGTLGMGAAVVGLTAAAIVGIGSAVKGEFNEISSREAAKNAEELASSEDENVRQWATNSAWNKTVGDMEAARAQGGFKESFANTLGGLKTGWLNLTSSDYIKKNEAFWDWMHDSGVFSEGDEGYFQRIAAYFLFDKAGSLESIPNVSRTDLEQFAQQGYGKRIQQYANQLVEAGWAPSNKNKQKVSSQIDWESYGAPEGSYKVGLSYVPYDEFPAILHKGESILTKEASDKLRALTDKDISKLAGVENALDNWSLHPSSYAIGTDYIVNNGQLAYLHEGEAVLTKSAANVLRSSTNSDISSVYGVSDAISNGSALNREGFGLVVSAINNQTTALVTKMDQILTTINSSKRTATFNNKLTTLESGGF